MGGGFMARNLISLLFFMAIGMSPFTYASENKMQTIDVVIGDCICGNHVASFEAIYKGNKIIVELLYGGKTKIFRGNNEIKDWYDSFCPKGDSDRGPLTGKKTKVKGKWQNLYSFEANSIHIVFSPI